MLKRHEVEILLRAGHAKTEVARLSGVSLRSVKRIAEERPVEHVDDARARVKRQIGRPSTVTNFRKQVVEIVRETPDLGPAPEWNAGSPWESTMMNCQDFTSDKIPRYYYLLARHKSIQLTAYRQVEECPVSDSGADRTNSGNQLLDIAPLGKRWSRDSGALREFHSSLDYWVRLFVSYNQGPVKELHQTRNSGGASTARRLDMRGLEAWLEESRRKIFQIPAPSLPFSWSEPGDS